jgi:hypothetical protein
MAYDLSLQSASNSLITGAKGQTGYWLDKELEALGIHVFRSSIRCVDFNLNGLDQARIWEGSCPV